jgi:hypothetical protein
MRSNFSVGDLLLTVARTAQLGEPRVIRMLTHFPTAVPEIPVSNVEKAAQYYVGLTISRPGQLMKVLESDTSPRSRS